jgi:radical SAM enzyme (TIGR01210 family)
VLPGSPLDRSALHPRPLSPEYRGEGSAGLPLFDDASILAVRPPRNAVDPSRPYAFLVEPECSASGEIVEVATLFLTNRECPFRCLMCDLWKNTTTETVEPEQIPAQIDFALSRLPPARQIKLYNSGNFFDPRAIPPEDYPAIAERVRGFERVIVENHPKLCTSRVLTFRDLIAPAVLEVALGLETVHPEVLPRLNKEMTLDDFARAAEFLRTNLISMRTFILLRPPFLSEQEGVEWAMRSIEFAFDHGVECCSVVPTRGGNGIMEQLAAAGQYAPPSLAAIESVLEQGIATKRGRAFVDLWDLERFSSCSSCFAARADRLAAMNLRQVLLPAISCGSCDSSNGGTGRLS